MMSVMRFAAIVASCTHLLLDIVAATSFTDCKTGCSFLSDDPTTLKAGNVVGNIILPALFQMTFDFQVAGNDNLYPTLSNIIEIYSVTLDKPLLSISLEPVSNSNQVHIIYNSQLVVEYGPPVVFSPTSFSSLTVTVQEFTVTFSSQVWGKTYPIGGAKLSTQNILYASSKTVDATHVSAIGTIQNIVITAITRQPTLSPSVLPTMRPTGPTKAPSAMPTMAPTPDPFCCASTAYYSTDWQQCNSAADASISKVKSCSECYAYHCIDWTVGSAAMQARETTFFNETGEKVYLAVGSYGTDPSLGGLCYRVSTDSLDRDVIFQVVNQEDISTFATGPEVNLKGSGDVFLQMADGGLGAADSCTLESSPLPMYLSSTSDWGDLFGGWATRDDCQRIPAYPICGQYPDDNMQELCRWSFDKGFRRFPGSFTPKITNICQVACPSELYLATGLHRSDEPSTLLTCPPPIKSRSPPASLRRSMDCAKPHYAFPNTILGGSTYPGYSTVVPCRRDGYARINSIPTKPPTPMPSFTNTVRPTRRPSYKPTFRPSGKPTQPPTEYPTTLPTIQPTNSSQYINPNSKSNALSTTESKIVAVLASPVGGVAMGVFILIMVIMGIICVCERSLQSKAQAARQANTDKIKAERRRNNALQAVGNDTSGGHYKQEQQVRRQHMSPFKKITNFFAPRRFSVDDLEVIL